MGACASPLRLFQRCSNRHQGDTDLTKIPTKEQQLNGKNFGRATPQYGSYGAKRR